MGRPALKVDSPGNEPEDITLSGPGSDSEGDAASENDADDDKFEKILLSLTAGKPLASPDSNSKRDPMEFFMLMMMQNQRETRREIQEAKREKNDFLKMALTLLPSLLGPKGPDPLMIEMVKGMMGNKQQEEFTKSILTMQQANSQANLDMIRQSSESMMKAREEANRDEVDRLRERLDKEPGASSPVTEIVREMRLLAEPFIAAKFGAGSAAKTETKTNPSQTPKIEGPTSRPEQIPIILRALKNLHESASMSKSDKNLVRAKIASIIIEIPPLAEAICNIVPGEEGNPAREQVADICKPYVMADGALAAWLMKPETQPWLDYTLIRQIAPIVDSMMEANEVEEGQPVDDDDETDLDGENPHQPGDTPGLNKKPA